VASAEAPPVELLHQLKLYREVEAQPAVEPGAAPAEPPAPVVRDRYDEFVFVSPPAAFHEMLQRHTRVQASTERSEPVLQGAPARALDSPALTLLRSAGAAQ
jgi:hypothetical protein